MNQLELVAGQIAVAMLTARKAGDEEFYKLFHDVADDNRIEDARKGELGLRVIRNLVELNVGTLELVDRVADGLARAQGKAPLELSDRLLWNMGAEASTLKPDEDEKG